MDSGVGNLAVKIGDTGQTGLDLLSKYQKSNMYTRAKIVTIWPINPVSNEGPYQFTLGGYNSNDLIILKSVRMTVKFRVLKKYETNIESQEKLSIVNTPVHSLFENVGVMLNDTPISNHAKL